MVMEVEIALGDGEVLKSNNDFCMQDNGHFETCVYQKLEQRGDSPDAMMCRHLYGIFDENFLWVTVGDRNVYYDVSAVEDPQESSGYSQCDLSMNNSTTYVFARDVKDHNCVLSKEISRAGSGDTTYTCKFDKLERIIRFTDKDSGLEIVESDQLPTDISVQIREKMNA